MIPSMPAAMMPPMVMGPPPTMGNAYQFQNPALVGPMGGGMGGGFNYVPPALNTPAGMGGWRTPQIHGGGVGTPGVGAGPGTLPFIPASPFYQPGIRSPFMRPFEAQLAQSAQLANLGTMGQQQALQVGGAGLLGAVSGVMGTGLGMAGGAAVGGGVGMDIGGALGGMVLGPMIASNPMMQQMTGQMFRPAIERTADISRTMGATRGFVVGGNDLDISGQGLSVQASRKLTDELGRVAQASQGQFTRRDMVDMLQASGEQGLLDFVQNADQIADSVKKVSKIVGTMAQITGDPDFKNNIRLMGELRRQGASLDDMASLTTEFAQFGRMAGLSATEVLGTGGQQGAATFQAAGLSRVQGARTGAFGMGVARQAVAAGAFNESQLDRFGGMSGVGQRLSEMQASFLANSEAMIPALVKRGEGGKLEIDQEKLDQFRRGEKSISQLVSEGASAANDPKMLQDLIHSMKDLKDEMAGSLGPQGTFVSMVRQIDRTQKELGVTFESAANVVLGDKDSARQLTLMMKDPEFIQNRMQQLATERSIQKFEAVESERADRGRNIGFSANAARTWNRVGDMIGLGSAYDSLQTGVSDFYTERLERERLAGVGKTLVRREGAGRVRDATDEMREAAANFGGVGGQRARYQLDAYNQQPTMGEHMLGLAGSYLTPGGFGARVLGGAGDAPVSSQIAQGIADIRTGDRMRRATGMGERERNLVRGANRVNLGEEIFGPGQMAQVLNAIPGAAMLNYGAGEAMGGVDLAMSFIDEDAVATSFGEDKRKLTRSSDVARMSREGSYTEATGAFDRSLGKTGLSKNRQDALRSKILTDVQKNLAARQEGFLGLGIGDAEAFQEQDVTAAIDRATEGMNLTPSQRAAVKQSFSSPKARAGILRAANAAAGGKYDTVVKLSEEQGLDAITARSVDEFTKGDLDRASGVIEDKLGIDLDDPKQRAAKAAIDKHSDPKKAFLYALAARIVQGTAKGGEWEAFRAKLKKDGVSDKEIDELSSFFEQARNDLEKDPEMAAEVARIAQNIAAPPTDTTNAVVKAVTSYHPIAAIWTGAAEALGFDATGAIQEMVGGERATIEGQLSAYAESRDLELASVGVEQEAELRAAFKEAGLEFKMKKGETINTALQRALRDPAAVRALAKARPEAAAALQTAAKGGDVSAARKALVGTLGEITPDAGATVGADTSGIKTIDKSMQELAQLSAENEKRFGSHVDKMGGSVKKFEEIVNSETLKQLAGQITKK